jgi:hypothetical protein
MQVNARCMINYLLPLIFSCTSSVEDIFEPVTWHHQRHPFIRALTCKTGKTRRGVAGEASSDDQVSPVFFRRGERESRATRDK